MKHVIEYKLFESKESIVDNCFYILIDFKIIINYLKFYHDVLLPSKNFLDE